MSTIERLLKSCGGIDWTGQQDLRFVNQQPLGAEKVGIYQSFSRPTNYFKNFYLSLCHSNFQQMSKQNPIHLFKSSPLLKNLKPSYVKNFPIKGKLYEPLKDIFFKIIFLANLQDILEFHVTKIFVEPQRFLEVEKSKGRIQRSPNVKPSLKSLYFFVYF